MDTCVEMALIPKQLVFFFLIHQIKAERVLLKPNTECFTSNRFKMRKDLENWPNTSDCILCKFTIVV